MSIKDHSKDLADSDGQFRRKESVFRSWISSEPDAEFPPEAGRYVLYINYGCPWAHRTNIVRVLKGLEDIIQLVVMASAMGPEGWIYDDSPNTDPKDPLYGFTKHKDLYLKADPDYTGRYTVPTLWDKKRETIVSNESAEIIRMFYSAFDSLLATHLREANKPNGGLLPSNLLAKIDEMNSWIYPELNNGVYKTGFAASQAAYDENVVIVFSALDKLEKHLGSNVDDGQGAGQGPYMLGRHLTEVDIRVFTTLIRFDVAYHTIFRCNLKMIRHDYPRLDRWLRHLYWDESEETKGAFRKTTDFASIKSGYARTQQLKAVPMGPVPDILPKD